MNKETEFGYGGELYDILSGIRDLLRDVSNDVRKIDTANIELDTIRKKFRGEKILKGDYDINGMTGTKYTHDESEILKNLLDIKIEYWNPSWDFVSWKELFSKIDKINMILEKIGNQKGELENILIKLSEIKTKVDTIFKYLPG